MSQDFQVREFYKDRCIFITGGTGFLGRALVQKLLTECPEVGTLYLLIRSKGDLTPLERLQRLLSGPMFEGLSEKGKNKIKPVKGDCALDQLGIEPQVKADILEKVSLVFHFAATIKFNEPLSAAFSSNVKGTQRVMDLCKETKNLKAFVHVSTAFVMNGVKMIKEQVHPYQIPMKHLLESSEWMPPEVMDCLYPALNRGQVNTYCLSKFLAERVVLEERGTLPAAIVRPSIVGPAWKYPVPGFIDLPTGFPGLIPLICTGIFRGHFLNRDTVLDMVPLDLVVNETILVGWYTSQHSPGTLKVYNSTAPVKRPLFSIMKLLEAASRKYPSRLMLRAPKIRVYDQSSLMDSLRLRLTYWFTCMLGTISVAVSGTKSVNVSKIVGKIHHLFRHCENIHLDHEFERKNRELLLEEMSPGDKEIFKIEDHDFDLEEYFIDHFLYNRKCIFKEDMSTLPQSRKRLKLLEFMETALKLFVLSSLFSIIYLIFLH